MSLISATHLPTQRRSALSPTAAAADAMPQSSGRHATNSSTTIFIDSKDHPRPISSPSTTTRSCKPFLVPVLLLATGLCGYGWYDTTNELLGLKHSYVTLQSTKQLDVRIDVPAAPVISPAVQLLPDESIHSVTQRKQHPTTVKQQSLLPHATTAGDSSATHLLLDTTDSLGNAIQYPVCHFENVCIGSDSVSFRVQNRDQYEFYQRVFDRCFTSDAPQDDPQYGICRCFHPWYKPRLLPYEYSSTPSAEYAQQLQDTTQPLQPPTVDSAALPGDRVYPNMVRNHQYYEKHYWSSHKWVSHQHIAHWSQKLLYMQSLLQHRAALELYVGKIDGLVFHDTELPVPSHFDTIMNLTLQSSLDSTHPLYRNYFNTNQHYTYPLFMDSKNLTSNTHADQQQFVCVNKLSMTPVYGMLSESADDTEKFRTEAYKHYRLTLPIERCPPRNAVFLYRENRGILNWQEIQQLALDKYNIKLERVTINEQSSSFEQASLFANAGLIISSHSSQLINVMFSHPGQVIVEVTANFYNSDFAQYAHAMGVRFEYALGGDIPGGVTHEINQQCLDTLLSTCDTDGQCIVRNGWRCRGVKEDNKLLDYSANITAVDRAIRAAVGHLNWQCAGRWNEH